MLTGLPQNLSQLSIQAGFGTVGALHWTSTPEAHFAFRQALATLVHYNAHQHTLASVPEAQLAFQQALTSQMHEHCSAVRLDT